MITSSNSVIANYFEQYNNTNFNNFNNMTEFCIKYF